MSSKLTGENSPFIFVLNKKNGQPILGVSFGSDSESEIDLNQINILAIPSLVENSFNIIENIKTLYNIVPKKIVISACKSEYGTATIINNSEYYIDLPQKFLSKQENLQYFDEKLSIDSSVLEDLQNSLSSIINTANSEYIKPLNTAVNYMHDSLKKYFTFISVFNDSGKCLTSTLGLNSKENQLAKQVFNKITNKEQITEVTDNADLNLSYKQLGNVVVFYFYLKDKYFFLYSIDNKINIGITKLKLSAYIKNNKNEIISIIENLIINDSKIENQIPSNEINNPHNENIKITLEIN